MSAPRIERMLPGVRTGLVCVFLLGPLAVRFAISVTANGCIGLPDSGMSLRWHKARTESRLFLSAAVSSLILALQATAAATVVGTLAAIAVTRYRFPGRETILLLAGAPLFVPLVMAGLAILVVFSAVGGATPAVRLFAAMSA
jgi:putative spermidine/putrescine transport system permease protein